MMPEQFEALDRNELEDIKARVHLAEIVGRYARLLKRSGKFFALCPFHDERSPSFLVEPGHYHCFGCGAHGDHVDFLMHRLGLSFWDALRQLRELVGAPSTRSALKPTRPEPRRPAGAPDPRALVIWKRAVPA